MAFNPLPNAKLASYERGFGDFTMKADIDSLREISYIGESKQLLLFSDLYEGENPVLHAPRYLARKAIQELKDLGITVKVQCDLNFMLFFKKFKELEDDISRASPVTENNNLYNTLYKQSRELFLNKLKNTLKTSNINVESIRGDSSPGQFMYSLSLVDPMEFCDSITLLKLVSVLYITKATKKVAHDQSTTASFMAKVKPGWMGNSANIKLVLQDKDGKNILDSIYYV